MKTRNVTALWEPSNIDFSMESLKENLIQERLSTKSRTYRRLSRMYDNAGLPNISRITISKAEGIDEAIESVQEILSISDLALS